MPRLKLFLNHVAVCPIDPPAPSEAHYGHEEELKSAQRGVVLFAGPGKMPSYAVAFKPGDVVWYDADAGHRARIGENDVIVIDDEDVFALESDLENESRIKPKVLEILKAANVTSDGKFECCEHDTCFDLDPEADPEAVPTHEPDPIPRISAGVEPGPTEPGGEFERTDTPNPPVENPDHADQPH